MPVRLLLLLSTVFFLFPVVGVFGVMFFSLGIDGISDAMRLIPNELAGGIFGSYVVQSLFYSTGRMWVDRKFVIAGDLPLLLQDAVFSLVKKLGILVLGVGTVVCFFKPLFARTFAVLILGGMAGSIIIYTILTLGLSFRKPAGKG